MADSPIQAWLEAIDELDLERALTLITPECRLLVADGRRAEGREAARELVSGFVSELRSTSHRIVAQWHQGDVWIAEVEASYELRDWLQLNSLPRAFIVRAGPDGIFELHVYGAHERPLGEHGRGEEGMWISDRWIPPL